MMKQRCHTSFLHSRSQFLWNFPLHLLISAFLLGSCTSKVDSMQTAEESAKISSEVKVSSCQGEECNSCVLPWGGMLPDGQSLNNVYTQNLISCTEECTSFTTSLVCENGQLKIKNASNNYIAYDNIKAPVFAQCEKKKCQCENDGIVVEDGNEFTFFQTMSVGCEKKCVGQKLKCTGGKLVGAIPTQDLKSSYPFKSCIEIPCAQCKTPWNVDLNHKDKFTAFKTNMPACGQKCEAQKIELTCNNGLVTGGDTNLYKYEKCTPKKCDCTMNGVTVTEGTTIDVFKSGTELCGGSCTAQKALCDGGVFVDPVSKVALNTTVTYKFTSCAVNACKTCKTPWNATMNHATSITAYKNATLSCGQTCDSNKTTLTCTDGNITGGDVGIYKEASCAVTACKTCTLPCGREISSGSQATCYSSDKTLDCGTSCNAYQAIMKCKDGVVVDPKNDSPILPTTLTKFNAFQCAQVDNCASCALDNGTSVQDKKQVPFYKLDVVEPGQDCYSKDNMVILQCSNGKFQNRELFASFKFNTCKASVNGLAKGDRGIGRIDGSGGGAPNNMCLLPWAKQVVTHKTKIIAYSQSSAACGDSCQNYKAKITCDGFKGLWSGGATYVYPSCYEQKCN